MGAPVVLPEGDAESDTTVADGGALVLAVGDDESDTELAVADADGDTVGAVPAAHATCEPAP